MYTRVSRARRTLTATVGALLGFLSSYASAQLVPVSGTHYAGRASDTGFAGAVGNGGDYGASVPLDFSPADPALPIPLQVVYGGKRIGAAGLGWDVPVSYVYHDLSVAHRRPESGVAGPRGHERWTLTLLGERIDLVRNAADTAWIALRDHPQLEVRATGETLTAYDGEGRAYVFDSRRPGTTSLAGGNLYLLTSISDASGRTVKLDYATPDVTLASGAKGVEIDLVKILYNAHPSTAGCFKGEAVLQYDAPGAVLSMTMLGRHVTARSSKLTAIGVNAYASCGAAPARLRTYQFDYADPSTHQPSPDADTALPRLRSVTMTGRAGTPEANVKLPVASYGYGSVVDPATNKITYEKSMTVAPIQHAGAHTFDFGVAFTTRSLSTAPHAPGQAVWNLYTGQNLIDLNGDGRADFFDETGAYRNNSDSGGGSQFAALTQGGGADVQERIDSLTFDAAANSPASGQMIAVNDSWRLLVDMNGDGRMDVVEAPATDANHWILHLNTPDAADPKNIVWVDVTLPVAGMRAALNSTGATVGRVPIARKTTVPKYFSHCWYWEMSNARWKQDGLAGCSDIPKGSTLPRAITEFELRDVNGDGYPDFVFNASRVNTTDPVAKPPIPANPVDLMHASTLVAADMEGARDVKVLLNIAGTHLANGADVFSTMPTTWEVGGANGCGIERWDPDPAYASNPSASPINQVCGFEDVNGDGIADRVTSTLSGQAWSVQAALGTGDLAQPISPSATFALPGLLSSTQTQLNTQPPGSGWQTQCGSATVVFSDTHRTRGLRDINGDGIPDYVDGTTIAMGTGAGFTAPIAVVSPIALELSLERTACQDQVNSTPTGFYDLDGDGQAEIVNLVSYGQSPTAPYWDVYQLKRSSPQVDTGTVRSIPEAGRLTRIDNGYGAVTRIGYKSAKSDIYSLHQVPSSEIVATAIATTDASGAALAATLRYAFGNATQYFDPAADAFVPTGYGRTVQVVPTVDGNKTLGVVTITDTYGLDAFDKTQDAAARYKRYAKVGRISDVTTLSGDIANGDPWAQLTTDVDHSTRRIAGAHSDWEVRLLPAGLKTGNNIACLDLMHPYDYAASVADALSASDDSCVKNGFVFQTASVAWRGTPGNIWPPVLAASVVVVDNEVKPADVDDFGRVKAVSNYNDLNRADDDVCIQVAYAEPVAPAARPRVLNATAQRSVTNCASTPTVLARDTWEYDTANGVKLPAGKVANGVVTSQVVSRLDENGVPVPDATGSADLRRFEATVDARGNPLAVTSTRDDGATRTVASTYDAFGLVPMTTTVDAKNADNTSVPTLATSLTRDPATLDVLGANGANGTQAGQTLDGFGRVLTTSVVPASGVGGVMSATGYQGFAVGETGGRRIVDTRFTDPVAASAVATAAGRKTTTYLDTLGRVQRAEAALGADYGNQVLTLGQRVYDLQGRVKFVADAFPAGQSFLTAYGTTNFFNTDGTLSCTVRATGMQAPKASWSTSDTSAQVYPTCVTRTYQAFTQVDTVQAPDALAAGSAQAGVKTQVISTALGRPLSRSVIKGTGGPLLERTNFATDRFGRLVLQRRFKTPGAATQPVDTKWHYDSTGAMTLLEEQGNATRLRRFDSWGALTREQYCDDGVSVAPCPASDRRTIRKYDALGRLVHSEARSGGSSDTDGTLDADTVNDYTYDLPASLVNRLAPTYVLGRLASASSSTLQVSLSYDAFGRVNGRGYNDRHGNTNVEKHTFHADGSEQALSLLLNDNGFKDERFTFAYDSAGRPAMATYSDGATSQSLYAAGSGGVDVLGRIVQADYGATSYSASFDATGRRLINGVQLAGAGGTRQIAFPPVGALPAFDPIGRERSRTETIDGVARTIASTYDAKGRVATSTRTPASTALPNLQFSYDALDNLTTQADTGLANSPNNVTSAFQASGDLDRLCSVAYGAAASPATCNVAYDGAGNIVSEPSPTGLRMLSYYPNGRVKQIKANGSDAVFKYDAFGGLQSLQLTGGSSADTRSDRHFGAFVSLRNETVAGTTKSVMTRSIPVPGAVATRHGPTGPWSFAFSEGRGSRFVADAAGTFVQDIDYQAFGAAVSTSATGTATPGMPMYANYQWNGGDALSALGLVQLGARMYDPAIGRFMSRDPVFDPGNANAYAFAANDPVNLHDPTGTTVDLSIRVIIRPEGNLASGFSPNAYSGFGGGFGTATLGALAGGFGEGARKGFGNNGGGGPAPLSPLPGGFIGPGEIERGGAGGGDGAGGSAPDSSPAPPSRNPFLFGDEIDPEAVGQGVRTTSLATSLASDALDAAGGAAKMSESLHLAGHWAHYLDIGLDTYEFASHPSAETGARLTLTAAESLAIKYGGTYGRIAAAVVEIYLVYDSLEESREFERRWELRKRLEANELKYSSWVCTPLENASGETDAYRSIFGRNQIGEDTETPLGPPLNELGDPIR